jgi:hypothetical protein
MGVIRFNKVEPTFRFFLILMCAGLLNEILNFFIPRAGYSNAVNSNIYLLTEAMLVILFFKKLLLFDRHKWLFPAITVMFWVVWIIDNLILSSITEFSSYFSVIASFVYVLMSVTLINRLIVAETKVIARHPVFLICIGFTLFFTFALIVEIFWIYGLNSSQEFRLMVYRIMTCTNIVVNLILTLAVIWIPKKREYTLL